MMLRLHRDGCLIFIDFDAVAAIVLEQDGVSCSLRLRDGREIPVDEDYHTAWRLCNDVWQAMRVYTLLRKGGAYERANT